METQVWLQGALRAPDLYGGKVHHTGNSQLTFWSGSTVKWRCVPTQLTRIAEGKAVEVPRWAICKLSCNSKVLIT